jgi:hypothetical protein
MTVHLIKLCVGVSDVQELADWQERRLRQTKRVYHVTRMVPKRAGELSDGGSIYWVIRPVPRRAFQGWRYLKPADAPLDLPPRTEGDELPPKLRAELAALGLL